jgi:hypothetical protein
MLSRAEILKKCWIHVNDQLPPSTDKNIVCYSLYRDNIFTLPGWLARRYAEEQLLFLQGKKKGDLREHYSPDKIITHWLVEIGRPEMFDPLFKEGSRKKDDKIHTNKKFPVA